MVIGVLSPVRGLFLLCLQGQAGSQFRELLVAVEGRPACRVHNVAETETDFFVSWNLNILLSECSHNGPDQIPHKSY